MRSAMPTTATSTAAIAEIDSFACENERRSKRMQSRRRSVHHMKSFQTWNASRTRRVCAQKCDVINNLASISGVEVYKKIKPQIEHCTIGEGVLSTATDNDYPR